MSLEEKLTEIAEVMRGTKESWVATGPENTDLSMFLHFWRGDELVAAAQTPLDRDTGLKAGMLGARGFSATTMAITFESYQAVEPHSPMTGLDWRPGEMQYVFKTQPDQTSVLECM